MNGPSPFFSVVVPAYNREALVGTSIQSVLAQTSADWELIVVDDGSTDNTAAVVRTFTDPRIRYVYQPNAERSAARNNGIAHARGRYITFLDSDDYFLPGRLEHLRQAIAQSGVEEGFFYTSIAFERDGVRRERAEMERGTLPVLDFIAQATIGNPQAVIHRNILEKHRYDPRFTIGEDMELWLRIAGTHEPRFLAGPCTVVALDHDERSVNVSHRNSYAKQLDMLRAATKKPHPGHRIGGPLQRTLFARAYFGIAKYHIFRGARTHAAFYLLRSIWAKRDDPQTLYKINLLANILNPYGGRKKAAALLRAGED